MKMLRTILVPVAAMIGGSPALAAKNPDTVPVRFEHDVTCGGPSPEYVYEGDNDFCAGTNNFASHSANPRPLVSVYSSNPGNFSADTYAAIGYSNYEFVVWGGNVGDVVPLKLYIALQQDSSGPYSGAHAFASVTVFSNAGTVVGGFRSICTLGCAGSGGDANEYEGALSISAYAGFAYTVSLVAEARTSPSLMPTFASAMADPYISIDPSFANAALYSIAVPEGVGNAPFAAAAVPEPASWAMMIAGIGLTGGVLRRRGRGGIPRVFYGHVDARQCDEASSVLRG